ncbi:hypothetical protein F66182_4046 [Fusarium sp. NRRL 66182]|nr:hypothetical protein F66182_4046 [Fusarium sp. NRRL 66182]
MGQEVESIYLRVTGETLQEPEPPPKGGWEKGTHVTIHVTVRSRHAILLSCPLSGALVEEMENPAQHALRLQALAAKMGAFSCLKPSTVFYPHDGLMPAKIGIIRMPLILIDQRWTQGEGHAEEMTRSEAERRKAAHEAKNEGRPGYDSNGIKARA